MQTGTTVWHFEKLRRRIFLQITFSFRVSNTTDVSEAIVEAKRKYNHPYLIIACDFNQWDFAAGLSDLADIKEAEVGNTRKDRALDKIFTNFSNGISQTGTLAPLESKDAEVRRSDHQIGYCTAKLPRLKTYCWKKFPYQHYNDCSVEDFKKWIVMHDWIEVFEASGSNDKVDAYQATITAAIEQFFPLKTTRRKMSNLPWLNMIKSDTVPCHWTTTTISPVRVWNHRHKRAKEICHATG